MSDSKGFWSSVTVTDQSVTRKVNSYKATANVTLDSEPLFDAYKSVINYTREMYLRVPTKSGKPKRGPRYLCVTRCTEEGELGLTGSHIIKAKRWVCKTCLSLCVPVWSDGPLPDEDEMQNDYADYMAKREIRRFR